MKSSICNILLFVFLLTLLMGGIPFVKAEENIVIYTNESTVLSLNGQFSEYALGNDEVAGCVVRRNDVEAAEVVVNGVSEGTTNLIVWDMAGVITQKFNIIVKGRDLGQAMAEVQKMLGGIEGVKVEIVGEKIVVKGQVLTIQDMRLLSKVLEERTHIVNTVTLSPTALKVLAKVINEFAGGQDMVEVKPIDQTLVLSGITYGAGTATRIEEFAKIFHNQVVNLIKEKTVEIDPGAGKMIQVQAHFMEVNKNAIQSAGFNWAPLAFTELAGSRAENRQDGNSTQGSVWQLTGFLTDLLPKFHQSRERNLGRQLRVSSVSVKSGEKAEFHSGGELGYPVASTTGVTTLAFKKYGILLKVLPIAQGNKITLKIMVKVNLPADLGSAFTGGSASLVNFTNSEVDTVQYCASGDSVAISGLLGEVDRKTFDASPGNSNALFELFSSKDFQTEKSELIIFITPEILEKASDANIEIKHTVLDSFDEYDPISR